MHYRVQFPIELTSDETSHIRKLDYPHYKIDLKINQPIKEIAISLLHEICHGYFGNFFENFMYCDDMIEDEAQRLWKQDKKEAIRTTRTILNQKKFLCYQT